MWWAFALNFVTGILLFMADATTKAGQLVFYVKLAMIALALLVDDRDREIPAPRRPMRATRRPRYAADARGARLWPHCWRGRQHRRRPAARAISSQPMDAT